MHDTGNATNGPTDDVTNAHQGCTRGQPRPGHMEHHASSSRRARAKLNTMPHATSSGLTSFLADFRMPPNRVTSRLAVRSVPPAAPLEKRLCGHQPRVPHSSQPTRPPSPWPWALALPPLALALRCCRSWAWRGPRARGGCPTSGCSCPWLCRRWPHSQTPGACSRWP